MKKQQHTWASGDVRPPFWVPSWSCRGSAIKSALRGPPKAHLSTRTRLALPLGVPGLQVQSLSCVRPASQDLGQEGQKLRAMEVRTETTAGQTQSPGTRVILRAGKALATPRRQGYLGRRGDGGEGREPPRPEGSWRSARWLHGASRKLGVTSRPRLGWASTALAGAPAPLGPAAPTSPRFSPQTRLPHSPKTTPGDVGVIRLAVPGCSPALS